MKRLIIVTGASRGIGKSIAIELSRFYNAGSHFLLMARDVEKLGEVRDEIEKDSEKRNTAKLVSVDFSIPNQVEIYYEILKDALEGASLSEFERLIVVYNHGTLVFGNVSLVAQNELRQDFEINLFSVWSMLAAVSLILPVNEIEKQFHVNISSGYAVEPTASWSGHCCVKKARSARDMLFKCFALENPKLRVLNYEPGIVYTDMLKQAVEITTDYQEGYNSGKFLKPEETARKLIEILDENKFVSGSRVKVND